MPKKFGVSKTFSFAPDIVEKLNYICKVEHRSQTNLIELLIIEKSKSLQCVEGGVDIGKTKN